MIEEQGKDAAATTATDNRPPQNVQPVLFIGVGGTGMEVLLRVRRRILHATWGEGGTVRVGSLEEFPAAAFLHFDLAQDAVHEDGKAISADPLAELVKLPTPDRLVMDLDMMKYMRTGDSIFSYPNISEWFPLKGEEKLRTRDFTKGAGQIRAISRLYFYDKYSNIRDAILEKLRNLRAARENRDSLNRLKLTMDGNSRVRVVVVGSVAGGTGSGSFLDMGWLAQSLADTIFNGQSDVQLILFTPTGFAMANKDRTEANGYAALMELETCMRKFPQYVGEWDIDEGIPRNLRQTPYTDVYIIETANLGGHALKDVTHQYEMVADTLFEDFASQEFAGYKRLVGVNKELHKGPLYSPPMPDDFRNMGLAYYCGYSSFGQSTLDTQYSQQQDQVEYQWMAAMLEAFFGIAGQDQSGTRATDADRDDFLKKHLHLGAALFTPTGGMQDIRELEPLCAPFLDCELTETLLQDEGGGIEDAVLKKVNESVEWLKADTSSLKEWEQLLRKMLPALEQDVIRDKDTSAQTKEERVERHAKRVAEEKRKVLKEQLYNYLDNQDKCGLEFVLSLVDLLKAAFEHPGTGLVKLLEDNAQRYRKLRDAMRTRLIEDSLNNVGAAAKGGFFSGPDEKKAIAYMDILKKELGHYLSYHVRSVAAFAGAKLLRELSAFLGGPAGTDAQGNTLYTGLVDEFQAGRKSVLEMCKEVRWTTRAIADSTTHTHANYISIKMEHAAPGLPDRRELWSWAKTAFEDFNGSREIFPMLKTPEGKLQLLMRLRARATASLVGVVKQVKDPLADYIKDLDSAERKRIFTDFLRAAMPWIDANSTHMSKSADRYKCLIGVCDPKDWKGVVEEELKSCVPTFANISPDRVKLHATGIPGRAVCYCDYSGFPLCALKGLESWRTSYRTEGRKGEVLHTHIDPTLFQHPVVPSTEECKRLAADLRLFLLAVMLRKMERKQGVTIPPGQYLFNLGKEGKHSLGNERSFRTEGLPPARRVVVQQAVEEQLAELNALQLFALSRLAEYTAQHTYTPVRVADERGMTRNVHGFTHSVAQKLAVELESKAVGCGLSANARAAILGLTDLYSDWSNVSAQLDAWTERIESSGLDPYDNEREAPEDDGPDRCKRRVRKEFLLPGWLARLCGVEDDNASSPDPLNGPWWFGLDGQKVGPCDDKRVRELVGHGKVGTETKAWKKGMGPWELAGSLPDLAALFEDGPPPLDEDGPPPL